MSKFYKRMELLRTTYKLTTRELAMILNIKAPSITMWEKEKAQPTLFMFNRICNLFAVSSDFMLGHTDFPYNESFLLKLEDDIINYRFGEQYFGSHKDLADDLHLDVTYLDPKLRIKNYTQGERANIIFLANMYLSYKIAHCTNDAIPDKTGYCVSLIRDKMLLKKYENKEYLYLHQLNDTLLKHKLQDDGTYPPPFYNLEFLVHATDI